LGRRGRLSWRRAASVGADIGLTGERLDQAVSDATAAGVLDRRADDPGLVMLTDKGRTAAGELSVRRYPRQF